MSEEQKREIERINFELAHSWAETIGVEYASISLAHAMVYDTL